jgi:hypothetical protein
MGAIALSCDLDPEDQTVARYVVAQLSQITGATIHAFDLVLNPLPSVSDRHFNERLSEMAARASIAVDHISHGDLETSTGTIEGTVNLGAFARWAQTIDRPLSLPPIFPGAIPPEFLQDRLSPTPDVQDVEPAGPGEAPPYMTKGLRTLFDIMRKHWTNRDPKNPPKQSTVAAEIGNAFGWAPGKDGKPSRDADTLAAVIRPDDLADADPRSRRRKP